MKTLDARVVEARESRTVQLGLDRLSLAASLQALVRHGEPQRPEMAQQIASFVLSEVGRHPREQGLLYMATGGVLEDAVREGLESLREAKVSTELVVIGDGDRAAFDSPAVTWVPTEHAPGIPPCLVHYGDGPAYALIREEARDGVEARTFHTDDRSLVEHLAFRLQEELALPASSERSAHEQRRAPRGGGMSGRVFIADGDVARGGSVAEACALRGLSCEVVSHGAALLEMALAEVPDAVVCQLALPLIEGARLAAILEANPRTRGVPFVFLGDGPADAERSDLGGQVVPAPIDPAIVAGCVQTALGGPPGGEDGPRADAEGGVEGQLAQLPLADLLQLFHVSRKTGTVEVVRGLRSQPPPGGPVVLRAGDVVDASVGPVGGKKALFRLLAWDRGSFAFKPEPAGGEITIQMPTRGCCAKACAQIREWERMAVDLPPLSAGVTLKIPRSALPNVIHPLTQEVLMVLDLCSRVQEVVTSAPTPITRCCARSTP